jgi:DNA-binding MarR family transcriptional regulator
VSIPPLPRRLPADDERVAVANRLNSVAIHLLRRIARTDQQSGLTAERMSLLSVLVYGGDRTIGQLAEAERLTAPAITRTVSLLEEQGLVRRTRSAADRRVVTVRATAAGRRLMEAARARRIASLAEDLATLSRADLAALNRAATILDKLADG